MYIPSFYLSVMLLSLQIESEETIVIATVHILFWNKFLSRIIQ